MKVADKGRSPRPLESDRPTRPNDSVESWIYCHAGVGVKAHLPLGYYQVTVGNKSAALLKNYALTGCEVAALKVVEHERLLIRLCLTA